jgi:hypothetical protein
VGGMNKVIRYVGEAISDSREGIIIIIIIIIIALLTLPAFSPYRINSTTIERCRFITVARIRNKFSVLCKTRKRILTN